MNRNIYLTMDGLKIKRLFNNKKTDIIVNQNIEDQILIRNLILQTNINLIVNLHL